MIDIGLEHPADRLLASIEKKRSPVCVGIDPVIEKLPRALVPEHHDPHSIVQAIGEFCLQLLEAVAPYVPCVKFQSACFERYSCLGVGKLQELLDRSRSFGDMQTILDFKRGDIGISAEHYASNVFEDLEVEDRRFPPDWVTINTYLGEDGITPFLKYPSNGAFALVRTSNPGGDEIQNLELKDGRTVSHAVAEMVARIGSSDVGQRGYSSLGAVVGATKKQDAAQLRGLMPQQVFLVPGYGAQGGGVDDVLPCFKSDATGAIVTASRSVIYAFETDDPKWAEAVADSAAKFADEVGRAVGLR